MHFQVLSTSLSLALSLLDLGVRAMNVSVPVIPPPSSQPLSSTLISFSIEQDRWPEWTGVQSRNEFTFNALDNYGKLTGKPPALRVGADSEDRTTWSPDVDIIEAMFPLSSAATPYPEASTITVGDGFYELSKFLPSGTVMTWGVNLGANNATNAANMARSIAKAFDTPAVKNAQVTLAMIEIGNEADIFNFTGFRGSDWSVEEYVSEWEANAGPVSQAAGLKKGGVTFQGAAFGTPQFNPREIFALGILDSAPGKLITTISQHRYSITTGSADATLSSFLNKANVRSNLTLWQPDIAATKQRGLRYVIGETGSVAFHGAPGISNTAGAALWVIDYSLQAATLGIDELFFHEGVGYKYNFLQPVSLNRSILDNSPLNPVQPPHVMPSYYAGILVYSLIGTSGSAKIVELSVPDDNVSGYAVYEGSTLKRAVFINMHAWLSSSTGSRPSVHIDLSFIGASGSGAKKAIAKRLVIGHADDIQNLTFAGQSFETADARPDGELVEESVDIGKGVDLLSTEAVLLSF
ncbi:hypothetical protein QCA50_004616 [Cerrena zonata]|uniref:Beta-glucuronidase C-terminal domain-containing protein n=1 Tax=Cerrena zonata TaxID=2478898 RepID=A0AAW0GPK9_9APHY